MRAPVGPYTTPKPSEEDRKADEEMIRQAKRHRDANAIKRRRRRKAVEDKEEEKKRPKKRQKNKKGKKKSSKAKSKARRKRRRPKPPPPTKVDPAPLVKTKRTGVPTLAMAFSDNTVEQQQNILNAFLSLSGTELFQYTNERSVDGQFNDVSIISVLSDRRKDYSPNDIIDIYPAFVTDVYKGSGPDAGKLFFEIQGETAGGSMTVEFFISSSVGKIGSVDFV